jgi:hypothetical protein
MKYARREGERFATAEAVAGHARTALQNLTRFLAAPEIKARAAGHTEPWTTADAYQRRFHALTSADAWAVTPTSVTVSGWPYGAEVAPESARRIYGDVADAAERAVLDAGLTGATVTQSSPFSVLIEWTEPEQ